jgi:hypothetical protein
MLTWLDVQSWKGPRVFATVHYDISSGQAVQMAPHTFNIQGITVHDRARAQVIKTSSIRHVEE